MLRKVLFFGLSMFLVSCASQGKVKPEPLNYSIFDEIYKKPSEEVKVIVKDISEREGKVLKIPKYIKVYRGSYRDDKGNVVEGGFEYIRIDDGNPDTNF